MKRAPAHWVKWSKENEWLERASAWDVYQLEQLQQKTQTIELSEVQKARKRHLDGARLMQQFAMQIYEAAGLEHMAPDEAQKRIRDANDAWNNGVRVERMMMGDVTDIVEQRQTIEADVKVSPNAQTIDEMLERRIAALKGQNEALKKPDSN